MALELELKTYEVKKEELLTHKGKFVLIVGAEVVDVYSAYDDALKAGYARAKDKDFLVKKIESVETVLFFAREIAPCPI